MNSSLYHCEVMHHRKRPVDYKFRHGIFMFALDLDELDMLAARFSLISRNRFNFYSFHDNDHMESDKPTLNETIRDYLRAQGIKQPVKRITLLTHLRTLGHIFNPVSFYFAYDEQDHPLAVLAEVTNTFGEMKPWLLQPDTLKRDSFRDEQQKHFYISPFTELDNRLTFKVAPPEDKLRIYINSLDEQGPEILTALTGKRVPLTRFSLAGSALRFPLVTLKVIGLIHWHALRLWLKRVPYHRKGEHPHLQQGIIKEGKSP